MSVESVRDAITEGPGLHSVYADTREKLDGAIRKSDLTGTLNYDVLARSYGPDASTVLAPHTPAAGH
jgi:hypothetical protein